MTMGQEKREADRIQKEHAQVNLQSFVVSSHFLSVQTGERWIESGKCKIKVQSEHSSQIFGRRREEKCRTTKESWRKISESTNISVL